MIVSIVSCISAYLSTLIFLLYSVLECLDDRHHKIPKTLLHPLLICWFYERLSKREKRSHKDEDYLRGRKLYCRETKDWI